MTKKESGTVSKQSHSSYFFLPYCLMDHSSVDVNAQLHLVHLVEQLELAICRLVCCLDDLAVPHKIGSHDYLEVIQVP